MTYVANFYIYIYILTKWAECSPMAWETGLKMVIDAALLHTQYYKIWIKGKEEQ